MVEQGQSRALVCTADGYTYRITGDERNLYFHKMGRAGLESEEMILGTMRVVKAEVEAVRCTRTRGQTVVLVVFEGKTSRLVAQGMVKASLLMEVFSGVPLKLSMNLYSNVLTEQYELRLLSASLLVFVLRFLCWVMPEVSLLAPVVRLGWVTIPFLWLVPCAGRMLKGGLRDQFPMGAGMLAAAFCCACLWISAFLQRVDWSATVIPALIVTVIAGATYCFSRRKTGWKSVAVVMLVALLTFSAPAAVAVNGLFPLQQQRIQATVSELKRTSVLGLSSHRAVVEGEDVRETFWLSQEQFDGLTTGDEVEMVSATGLLGIQYRTLDSQ